MKEILKKERISLVFMATILVISVGLLALNQFISRDTEQISRSWDRFTAERSEKVLIVTALRQDLGYGGMIHEFKNYVLRGEATYLAKMQRHIGAAQAHLFQYRSLGVNGAEGIALDDLDATLQAYGAAAQRAAKLFAEGNDVTAINQQVKVNDGAALVALLALSGEAGHNDYAEQGKVGAINKLRAAIGYGGMIHEFKNYVLRGDALRVTKVKVKLRVAFRAIDDYQAYPLSDVEKNALDRISAMLKAYDTAIEKAQQLVIEGAEPKDVDEQVRVDDVPAFTAFEDLAREHYRHNTDNERAVTDSLSVVTALIDSAFWATLSVMSALFFVSSWALWTKQRRDSMLLAKEKAQAILIADKQAAENANKMKSEFLASMSHEIRTPMASVMGMTDAILEGQLDATVREKVYNIKDASKSLLTIINDILDISKLEAGKLRIENVDFNLSNLIDDVLHLFDKRHRANIKTDLNLITKLSEDFPGSVHADPTRLRQILVNLVGNAVKFTNDGKVTISGSRLFADSGKEFIRFEITDTGIGIDKKVLGSLFTNFTQADASISRRYEGTGLGLSICKQLTELMGGDIGVTSELGKGSTFWFTLPYVAAKGEVPTSDHARKSITTQFKAKRKLNILIADDTVVLQHIVAALIARLGHSSEVANNGEEAVQAHQNGDFDLILMDVRMPKMSGPEATKAIRCMEGDKARIPIIAVTADAIKEQLEEHLTAGMDAYVTKPIDREKLVKAIDEVMGEEIHEQVPIASTHEPGAGTTNISGASTGKTS